MRIATASVRTGFAMTGSFTWGAVVGGRTGASIPMDMWKRLRRAGLQEVRQNGPSGTPAPTEGYKGCGGPGDRKGRPYPHLSALHFSPSRLFDIVNDDFRPPCGRFGHPANF